MRFDWTYPAVTEDDPVGAILDVWSDSTFYDDLAAALRLEKHDVDISGDANALLVRQMLQFSTRGIPSMFRSLLGVSDSMVVQWSSTFPRDGSTGTMTAATEDQRLTFAPSSRFAAGADGVRWLVEGDVRLKAPWPVRGTAETQLAKLLTRVLADQATVTERRISKA